MNTNRILFLFLKIKFTQSTKLHAHRRANDVSMNSFADVLLFLSLWPFHLTLSSFILIDLVPWSCSNARVTFNTRCYRAILRNTKLGNVETIKKILSNIPHSFWFNSQRYREGDVIIKCMGKKNLLHQTNANTRHNFVITREKVPRFIFFFQVFLLVRNVGLVCLSLMYIYPPKTKQTHENDVGMRDDDKTTAACRLAKIRFC